MSFSRNSALFGLPLLASLAFAPVRADNLKDVVVTGEAAFNGDLAATENAAKRDARRNAVEQAAGVLVESSSIVRNYELLADEISTSSRGVIVEENWGPLEASTANSKKITLKAKVSPEAISSAVCAVVRANHNPKLAVVIVEKVGQGTTWSAERGLVESMFTRAFKENCFDVVEPAVTASNIAANGDLPKEAIDAIVKNSDAQYVIIGSAKITDGGRIMDSNITSYTTTVNLKLINVANLRIEAVSSKTKVLAATSEDQAINGRKSVARDELLGGVMDDILKEITKAWASDLVNAARVSLVITRCSGMAAARAVKETIEGIPGAKVEIRGVGGGTATMDVTLDGGAEVLAEFIENKKTGKNTISLIEVKKGKVAVALK
jgi:hypothetical protein